MQLGVRFLIADDRRATCERARALLSLYPYAEAMGEAWDGLDAIRFVSESQPPLVMMDTQRSVTSGQEATLRIEDR